MLKNKHICLKKEKFHKLLTLLFFIISMLYAFTQNEKKIADSLFIISKENIKQGSFKKALFSVNKSLNIYRNLEDSKYIGNCLNRIATIYYYQGKFSKSLSSFKESIKYFRKVNFDKGISSSFNNMGAIYYYLGNFSKALDYYKKAMKFHEKLNDQKQLAATTQNIGSIYLELNDFTNAMKYYQTAKKIYENITNKKENAQVINSIGEVYLKQKKYKIATSTFKSSLKIAIKNNEKQIQTEVLFNLGELYKEQLDYTKSLRFYNQSLNYAIEMENEVFESSSLVELGSVKLKLNKKKEALKKCKKGLKIAEKIKVISIQKKACECLYDSYKSINKANKALKYFEQMHLLKDSLNLKQTADNLLNMQFEKEMLLDSIAHVEKERKVQIKHKQAIAKKEKQRNIFIIAGLFALIIAGGIFTRLNFIKKSKARLQIEKDRSENLLLNILPEEIAEELKEKGFVDAQDFETASILFTDFKSFTETASKLSPQELVTEINTYFKAFDMIMETYNIEKIKTIGDAYMAAGGLPEPNVNAIKNTILAAIEMQTFVTKRKLKNDLENKSSFEMRVGIHVGPIVAGIVGIKKFQYDIWGDTVNTASRMESNSVVGKVNISQDTYLLVKDEKDLAFEYRGKITAKGKGELEMYFVSKINS